MKKLLFLLLIVFLFSCEERECICTLYFEPDTRPPQEFYGYIDGNCTDWNGKTGIYVDDKDSLFTYVIRCEER